MKSPKMMTAQVKNKPTNIASSRILKRKNGYGSGFFRFLMKNASFALAQARGIPAENLASPIEATVNSMQGEDVDFRKFFGYSDFALNREFEESNRVIQGGGSGGGIDFGGGGDSGGGIEF